MIDVEHLTKYYGQRAAVRDVSFNVGKGEIVGLLGPNGAGKTTTMRILTGYLAATSGTAIVAGYNVADNPLEVRRRLGYLPETVPLYTDMTVTAYLDFTAKIRGVPGKGRKRRVEEVMDLCRISDVKNKVIAKLSRGYRQRVGLAQAIVHNPQVIILDEPTVGLDPRQIIEIRQVIRDLAGGHSLILSTHILPEVSTLCDRVVIINRGRVLVEDTLANLEQQGAENERLRLEVRGPASEVHQTLQALPNIMRVDLVSAEAEEVDTRATNARELNRFAVEAAPGFDLREQIAAAVIGQGWGLLEMRTSIPSLEEIFVRLVSTDETIELEEEEQTSGFAAENDLDDIDDDEQDDEAVEEDDDEAEDTDVAVAESDEVEPVIEKASSAVVVPVMEEAKATQVDTARVSQLNPVKAEIKELDDQHEQVMKVEAKKEEVVQLGRVKAPPTFLQQADEELDEPTATPTPARPAPNYNKAINNKKNKRR